MQNSRQIFWLNIFYFFISLHYAVIIYSASTFLSTIFGEKNIWILYSFAALLTIILNISISNFIKKNSLNKLVKTTLLVAFLNLLNLAFNKIFFFIFISFILYLALAECLLLLSSILLEELSKNETTGRMRGNFLSIQHFGYLFAPFLSSFFIKISNINSIFFLSTIFIFTAFIIFNNNLSTIEKAEPSKRNFLQTIRKIFKNIDLRNIIFTYIGLHFFYSISVIYLPLKLAESGITLTQYLGVLLPIGLFPFLFVPEILGYVEDKMKDEKEFIVVGFIGIIFMLNVFAFVNSSSLIIWALILFTSRIFTSIVEVSISSYFFKKVERSDTDIISIFTSSYNLVNFIFVPIFAAILAYTDLKILFLSVSFFLCFVLVLVSKIHNTKNYEKHKEWKTIWHKSKKRAS